MPTIVEEGQFRFVIYTRENDFEPPHVHLDLNSGQFMENPPSGGYRSILTAYRKHATITREEWDRIHGR